MHILGSEVGNFKVQIPKKTGTLKVHFFTSNNNIKVIGPVRRVFFSAEVILLNECFPWVETLHAQSTKPVGFKKSKIIEFRSLIRNIELFEV